MARLISKSLLIMNLGEKLCLLSFYFPRKFIIMSNSFFAQWKPNLNKTAHYGFIPRACNCAKHFCPLWVFTMSVHKSITCCLCIYVSLFVITNYITLIKSNNELLIFLDFIMYASTRKWTKTLRLINLNNLGNINAILKVSEIILYACRLISIYSEYFIYSFKVVNRKYC